MSRKSALGSSVPVLDVYVCVGATLANKVLVGLVTQFRVLDSAVSAARGEQIEDKRCVIRTREEEFLLLSTL